MNTLIMFIIIISLITQNLCTTMIERYDQVFWHYSIMFSFHN